MTQPPTPRDTIAWRDDPEWRGYAARIAARQNRRAPYGGAVFDLVDVDRYVEAAIAAYERQAEVRRREDWPTLLEAGARALAKLDLDPLTLRYASGYARDRAMAEAVLRAAGHHPEDEDG